MKNNDGLTPGHFAAGLENFDAMSLLLENGSDPTIESEPQNNVFSELIVNDYVDLLSCVWHLTKLIKPNFNDVSRSFLLTFSKERKLQLAASSGNEGR